MGKIEQIGKVTLDYSKYPEEDKYCDGDVEDEILQIARDFSAVEYGRVIEEKKSWPVLYHLSPLRENIVEWLPMGTLEVVSEEGDSQEIAGFGEALEFGESVEDGGVSENDEGIESGAGMKMGDTLEADEAVGQEESIGKDAKVLEVGSGCGAITGVLAEKAGSVTCVDLSKKRSMINAYRHSECENVTIHVGNFQDIEPDLDTDYDVIFLIGVFEYAAGYIGGDTPYEDFLKLLLKHLKKDGRLIIAIENKYGLKYFAGCKEDHLGTYFSGVENYTDGGIVRTFGRKGLEKIFQSAGVSDYHFYYPYPDYKFMTTLYSDAYLPGKGELSNNLRNFDRDRMLLFDEKNAFDGIVEENLFPVFSNSYLAVLGGKPDTVFVKYSNDRAPEYAIRTEIHENAKGEKCVRKYPLTKAAEDHVRQMAVAYENLVERYRGGELDINRCKLVEERENLYAEFEFVQGTPLSQLMDTCLEKEDMEGFHRYFREYLDRIGYNSEYPAADFDLIFSNILVEDEKWTLIDYEWTFGRAIDTKELAFRAVYCYVLENEKREKLGLERILEELNITEAEAENYREQEREFQKFVTGKRYSMPQMRELIGYRLMVPQNWIDRYQDSQGVNRVQIYEDTGSGYSEECSYFVKEAYQGESLIEFEILFDGNVQRLRIDPAMDSCMVKVLEMTLNGEALPLDKRKVLIANGRVAKPMDKENGFYGPSIVFPTQDPNINLDLRELSRQAENVLYARMEIVRIPIDMAKDMAGGKKWLT